MDDDMLNIPEVKMGLVTVSRDCFPKEISEERQKKLKSSCLKKEIKIENYEPIIETENDVILALAYLGNRGVNALTIYLGNFGPEGPETILAKKFTGPVMIVAAKEESMQELNNGRGDAYCGLLNASYNCKLRNVNVHIPSKPIGDGDEIAEAINDFQSISRALIGVSQLKIISFGPRPYDFLACNAPIEPLYKIGVEIMENSELDLYSYFKEHEDDSRLDKVVKQMELEIGKKNKFCHHLKKMAQYELTLLDWYKENIGASRFAVFANKCWPAFEKEFGFVPCYVHSRMAKIGIPVACEVDIYGALSEFILQCITNKPVTLIDINNNVPMDIQELSTFDKNKKIENMFIGFHCGNTTKCYLENPEFSYHKIMNRSIENGEDPQITVGTMEGTFKPGKFTMFRIQASDSGKLKSYIAEGEIQNLSPNTFGCAGVFEIIGMERFYRNILIEKNYPHHSAIGFDRIGKNLFSVLKMLGLKEIDYNHLDCIPYLNENPF